MACTSLYTPDVRALTLGTITVQSALGEPLRAEIDLPQITPAEAESLRAGTASADVFRTQGMEYSATVSQMRVQLQRRPDGRTVLRLSGSSPVNEPFVDLVIDAQWGAGHITRSYTMLFDPPAPRRSQAATALVAPSISAPDNRAASPPARRTPSRQGSAVNDSADGSADNAAPAAPVRPRRAEALPQAPTKAAAAEDTVVVRPGDTAGGIANARRQPGVSLDQMLVAMSRANPSAFVQGNVHRLKSGSVLQIPSQDEALTTPAGQARQLIAVQSRDFNAFRRNLASAAPDAAQAIAQRSASGSVQTRIEDNSATAPTPDKLTLSKGAMQGNKSTEEMLAQRKQGNAAAARAQELARNIEELNRLNATSGTPAIAAATPPPTDSAPAAAAAASGLALPNPGLALPTTPAPAPAADAAQGAASDNPAAVEAVSAPAQAPAVEATPTTRDTAPALAAQPTLSPVPERQPEPAGFVQDLMEQPALPLAGGALLLLLAFGAYRAVQRRRNPMAGDSSFVDSRVHADSFFDASGGQRVDTASADSTLGGASLSYSPSQLDAGGEVDPVAEADVYLAYGRDLQAEEILREAARHHPQRVSIPAKLGEIYAKRLDSKALEAVARDVRQLIQGQGPEWEHMVALGLQLDPDNPLYQSRSTAPLSAGMAGAAALGAVSAVGADSLRSLPVDTAFTQNVNHLIDLDLNLDFDLPEDALSDAPAQDLHSGAAANPEGSAAALAGAADWDALEDLVAFNAAIALPPEPAMASGQPAGFAEPAGPAGPLPAIDTYTPEAPPAAPVFERDELKALDPSLDRDLQWEELPPLQPESSQAATAVQADIAGATAAASSALDAFALDFDLPDMDNLSSPGGAGQEAAPPPGAAGTEAFVPNDSHLMDFDFDSLSLDLNTVHPDAPSPADSSALEIDAGQTDTTASEEDPLTTKLALAQEFHAIGDSEGARTLVEEVIAESSGTLKVRAQDLLAELN